MANTINYIPEVQQNLIVKCLNCGAERIWAFQCSCGKKFCSSCHPDAFKQEEFSDILNVTCPKCGTTILFV